MKVSRLLFLLAMATDASGACVRHAAAAASSRANPPPFDGPGSFGALQDTVTLDCLTYVGSIRKGGREYVLLRDELSVVHRLGVGDYVGENTGVITRIDRDAIHITQAVTRNGRAEAVTVRFARTAGK